MAISSGKIDELGLVIEAERGVGEGLVRLSKYCGRWVNKSAESCMTYKNTSRMFVKTFARVR